MKAFAMLGIIGLTMLASAPMVFAADTSANAGSTCAGEADCRVKWQRAGQWVRSQSEWPVKTATETLIETQRQRFRNYSRLYYRITRVEQEGNTVIRFDAGCLPSVHCNPDPEVARAEFNRFVRDGE